MTAILRKRITDIKNFMIELSESNGFMIHSLIFALGLILIILAVRFIGLTIISFQTFKVLIIGMILISIMISFLKLKVLRFIERLWIFRIGQIFLYFSIIFFTFFTLNYLISFKTDIVYEGYEIYSKKLSNDLFGKPKYRIKISEMTFHTWGSGGWINVDSLTYYSKGDFISVKINKGLFGLKTIRKDQK